MPTDMPTTTSPEENRAAGFHETLLRLLCDAVSQERSGGAASFYRAVARMAAETAGADGGSVFLVESDGEGLIEVAVHDPGAIRVPGRRFVRGEGVAGAALASARVEWHSAASPHPGFVATETAVRDIVALPACSPGRPPLGMVCIHNFRDPSSLTRTLELLESWRPALAHALRLIRTADNLLTVNRRLREENERVVQLHALASLVTDGAQEGEVAEAILRDMARLYGFERSGLFSRRGGETICLAARGLSDGFRPDRPVASRDRGHGPILSCLEEVLTERRMVVRSNDMHGLARGDRTGLVAVLGLPLESTPGGADAVILASGWGDAPRVDDVDPTPAQCYLEQAALALARCRSGAPVTAAAGDLS